MDGKRVLLLLLALIGLAAPLKSGHAAVIELSGLYAYSKSDFADGYKSTQRRYTGSIDFKFTSVSALQFEYTNSRTRISYPTNVGGELAYYTQEVTSYVDQVYSFNWVQNLVPQKWILQPYLVLGGGKMKRTLTREYPELRVKQTVVQNVTTGTAGAGLRLFFTKKMAVKGEMKTYVPKFQFSKWKESQQFSVGLSWVF